MTDTTVTANAVDEILALVPVGRLAAELGVDEPTAQQAARAVIPALLGGLRHNAHDPASEQRLAGALQHHAARGLLGGGQVDLAQVDAADGTRIVHHVFGGETAQLVQALGARTGGGPALVDRLLPLLAPVVMAYLARRLTQGPAADVLAGAAAGQPQGRLGEVLGGVLGAPAPYADQPRQGHPAPQPPAPQPQGGAPAPFPPGPPFPQQPQPAPPAGHPQGIVRPAHQPQAPAPTFAPAGQPPQPVGHQQPQPGQPEGQPAKDQERQGILGGLLGGLFGKRD